MESSPDQIVKPQLKWHCLRSVPKEPAALGLRAEILSKLNHYNDLTHSIAAPARAENNFKKDA